MRSWLLIILLACLLPACRNVPEEERGDLGRDIKDTQPEDTAVMRERLRGILGGTADSPPDGSPHLRARAAQGLGQFGDADDSRLLLDALLGPLRDENVMVRMESAIALGKLRFDGTFDPRRRDVIAYMRARLAFDRDDNGRPLETEFMVRSAMLNSLIFIGGRDAATAIYDVAVRVYRDLEGSASGVYTSATDRGLLDRCFEGLAEITGVGRQAAAEHRFENDDLARHIDWWAQQITAMPEN
jgi:hypothetical protein